MKLEIVVDNTQEFKQDLFDQLMSHGYSAKDAQELIIKRDKNYQQVTQTRNTVKILKITPLYSLDMPKGKQEIKDYLWELGYNTKKHRWAIDTCCYTWDNKPECGEVIIGSERTDKVWKSKRVDGKRVASDEAILYNSGIDLYELGYLMRNS